MFAAVRVACSCVGTGGVLRKSTVIDSRGYSRTQRCSRSIGGRRRPILEAARDAPAGDRRADRADRPALLARPIRIAFGGQVLVPPMTWLLVPGLPLGACLLLPHCVSDFLPKWTLRSGWLNMKWLSDMHDFIHVYARNREHVSVQPVCHHRALFPRA